MQYMRKHCVTLPLTFRFLKLVALEKPQIVSLLTEYWITIGILIWPIRWTSKHGAQLYLKETTQIVHYIFWAASPIKMYRVNRKRISRFVLFFIVSIELLFLIRGSCVSHFKLSKLCDDIKISEHTWNLQVSLIFLQSIIYRSWYKYRIMTTSLLDVIVHTFPG